MSKRTFLDNLRVAGNLLANGDVAANGNHLDPAATPRTAIWLTPASVKGFKAEDFQELGVPLQRALAVAVQEFERAAKQIPSNLPPTMRQFQEAKVSLEAILTMLGDYLASHEEAIPLRAALAKVDFPTWIVNWDYEAGVNEDGVPSVWITLYADESAIPMDQFGRRVSAMIPLFRSALRAAGIRRWPYVRLRTAQEHKAGLAS